MEKVGTHLMVAFLTMLVATSSQAQNSRLLSFEDALSMTLDNNHGLKQSQNAIEEKEHIAKARKSLYMPTIGMSANYTRISHDLHLDLNPVKEAILPLYETQASYGVYSDIPTGVEAMPYLDQEQSTAMVREKMGEGAQALEASDWDQTIQKKEFGAVDVNFNWILYAGGKIRAVNKVSQLQLNEQKEIDRQKQQEIFTELVQRYYGLNLALNATAIRSEVLDAMEKHLSDAEKLEKEGFIAKAEVLHVKMSHAEASREYMKAQRMESFLHTALKNTLSNDSLGTIDPVSALFVADSIEDINYFKELANSNSPLLARLESKESQTEQNYKIKRADFLPAVAVMGMYDVANKDLSPMMPDWMVGAGLRWTLFDGTARYHNIKSAKLQTAQVKELSADTEDNIGTAIEKYYNELEINIEQLKELSVSEEFATEYVRVRERAFAEEMINSTELVDARLALAKVRIAKLQAMYQYDVALAQLLQYCGATDRFAQYMKRATN